MRSGCSSRPSASDASSGDFCRTSGGLALRPSGGRGCSAADSLGAAALPAGKGSFFFGVFSIPAGLGTAFLYPSIQSCAQKWYRGRKGLATGVIGGAVGLSGAFLTVFVRTALRGFGPVQGIRGGVLGAGGALTLPVCLAGSALLTDPPPEKPRPGGQGKGERRTVPRPLAPADAGHTPSTGSAPERSAFPPRRCCCSAPSS